MLQYLRIKNLALMGEVTLEFERGFTVVTGETGAGKSILLGALSFLSGSRAEKTIIRQGAEACEVEAGLYFEDPSGLDSKLESLELPACEEGSLILRRSLSRQKMPKVQINGALTTLANLRTIGEMWIDFHGPGEPRKLLRDEWQRVMLDSYARLGSDLEDYGRSYHRWRSLRDEVESLREREQLLPEEREFLSKEVETIERAELSIEAVEELERDFNRLSRARELIEVAAELESSLSGEEGVTMQLSRALQRARELANMDETAEGLSDRLESAIIEVEDLGSEFASLVESCEFDVETSESLQERMEVWLELKRKYGPDVRSVLARREAMAQKVALQGDLEGSLARLEEEAERKHLEALVQADSIRLGRARAAGKLSKEGERRMKGLGFRNPQLRIEVVREKGLREYGNSKCRFLFAPSRALDLMPLNKIASSGEMARVMLALKGILASFDQTPVLVFDEVDANIGGEIAGVVGERLAELGKRHQVFSITHLPQVAARAGNHLLVRKKEGRSSVTVEITGLNGDHDGRVEELARMVGDSSSTSALHHAEELLKS